MLVASITRGSVLVGVDVDVDVVAGAVWTGGSCRGSAPLPLLLPVVAAHPTSVIRALYMSPFYCGWTHSGVGETKFERARDGGVEAVGAIPCQNVTHGWRGSD